MHRSAPPRALASLLALVAAFGLSGCETMGRGEPDLSELYQEAPPGAAPGSCWGKHATPAVIEAALASAAAALLTEPHLLGELRARGGIVRRNHRIVGRQAPLGAIVFRRHLIMRHQVPLQHFQFLTVLKADDVIRLHGGTHGDSRFLLGGRRNDFLTQT